MTHRIVDEFMDDFVTVAAIVSLTVLGLHGVTDALVIGSVAGLGGYRMYRNGRGKDDV